MDKMKEIPFIVPPDDEQSAIVEHIKRTLPQYDAAIEKLTAEIVALAECKAKLIADVVTGKVNIQDIEIPEYEFIGEEADADADGRGEEEEGNVTLE